MHIGATKKIFLIAFIHLFSESFHQHYILRACHLPGQKDSRVMCIQIAFCEEQRNQD